MRANALTIPISIQSKMHRLARISAEAAQLDKEIDNWFTKKGYETDPYNGPSLRDDNGISLTELSNGNDITEAFVKSFQTGHMNQCVKKPENTVQKSGITNKTPLHLTNLSARLSNILYRAGYRYLEDLNGKTSDDLKLIKGIGKQSYIQIYNYLKKRNLLIGDTDFFTIVFLKNIK